MKSSRNDFYGAIVWLAFTLGGLFFVVFFGGLIVSAISGFRLEDYTDGGQFGIYSVALLVGTLYIVAKPQPFRLLFTEWLLWVSILFLFLATAFFTMGTLYSKGFMINTAFFRWPSIYLFIATVIMSFVSVILDNRRMSFDPYSNNSKRQADLIALEKDFERTENK